MITEDLVEIFDDKLELASSAIAMKDSRDGNADYPGKRTRRLRARRDTLPLRIATFEYCQRRRA